MKIGSPQFPPQSLLAWSSSAYLSILPQDRHYLETVSPAWHYLRVFSGRWLNIRIDTRLRHDPRVRPDEQDGSVPVWMELYARSVMKTLHEEDPYFFRRVYDRVNFLMRANVRPPSEVVSGRRRCPKSNRLGVTSTILPLRARIWRRERVCLVWTDVPLDRRLVSVERNESRFASWLDNVAIVRKWLKSHRVDEFYETFYRETDASSKENRWWELEAPDTRPEAQAPRPLPLRLDHPMFAVWNLLRLVGTDRTKWETRLAPNPFKEELAPERMRAISDRAASVLPHFERPLQREEDLLLPMFHNFVQIKWPKLGSFPFVARTI